MAQECCNTDEKENTKRTTAVADSEKHEHKEGDDHNHDDDHDDDDGHNHGGEDSDGWKSHWPLLSSLAILLVMLILEFGFKF